MFRALLKKSSKISLDSFIPYTSSFLRMSALPPGGSSSIPNSIHHLSIDSLPSQITPTSSALCKRSLGLFKGRAP